MKGGMVGSDVGPFHHGTQTRELALTVKYSMAPLTTLQSDLLNGARLLGGGDKIGAPRPVTSRM